MAEVTLRQLAPTYLPRGAVTRHETFEPLGLRVEHHFGGGVYSKETRIPAGCSMGKHVHQHDHLSVLGSGFALLTVDGVSREVRAPACITIQAGKVHEVKALTDITWFCIHATAETDPGKIDHVLIDR